MKPTKPKKDYGAAAIAAQKNCTKEEKILWEHLRTNQVTGCHFLRKHPLEDYQVDFCRLKRKLAIFIEGRCRSEELMKAEATAVCRSNGFRVITFLARDINDNLPQVLRIIRLLLQLEEVPEDKKLHDLTKFEQRDKKRSDPDTLRGHPANAVDTLGQIQRIHRE